MPKQALVAYGVSFAIGLSIISPVCGSNLHAAETADRSIEDKSPESITEQVHAAAELLTFDEALARALEQNPQLSAYSLEIEARGYEAEQAGLFLNPEISVEMENFAGGGDYSGTDSAETTLLLSQRFELGGKRKKRLLVGQMDQNLAKQEYVAARAELTSRTATRFVSVLASQQRLALAVEQSGLAAKVLEAVTERIAAGKTASIEQLRFQTLLIEAKLRTEKTRQELATARQALAALWNQDRADFVGVQGDFERLPELPELPELTAKLSQSPVLAFRQAEIRKADQGLALEESKRIPDLTLSVGGRNFEETDDTALVAGIAINLPLFDRNQGAIGAARTRQAQARENIRTTQLHQQTALTEVWQRLQVARIEAEMLRDQLLPAVQESFEAITYGYQAGKFGYLEVLDAEQALFQTRSRYIDSLTTYHQTFAELEELLGQSLNGNNHEASAFVLPERGQS